MLAYTGKYDNLAIEELPDRKAGIKILLDYLPYDGITTSELYGIFVRCPKFIYSIYEFKSLGANFYIGERRTTHLYDCDLNRLYETIKKYNNDTYYLVDYLHYDNKDGMYRISFIDVSKVNFDSKAITVLRKLKIDEILKSL